MTSTRRSGSMRPRSTSSSVLGSSSTVRPGRLLVPIAIVLLVALAWGASAGAAEYKGPLIDVVSLHRFHVGVDRHGVRLVRVSVDQEIRLGGAGEQKDE